MLSRDGLNSSTSIQWREEDSLLNVEVEEVPVQAISKKNIFITHLIGRSLSLFSLLVFAASVCTLIYRSATTVPPYIT